MIKASVTTDLKPLEELKKSLVKKCMKKAMKQAAAEIVPQVKQNAETHHRYGYLAKVISVKTVAFKSVVCAVVGPRSKTKYTKGVISRGKRKGQPRVFRPSAYAHLVERGARQIKSVRPFLQPALDSKSQAFANTYNSVLKSMIDETLNSSN